MVRLVTLAPLDREAAAKLGGKLVATNPATGETATTGIEVTVEDVNDNTPEFSRKIYSLIGDRTAPRYSVVGRVEAKDKDGDSVVYSLARPATGPFIVVPQTGEILLTQEPQLAMYLLQVGAKDRGVPPRSAKSALLYLSFPPAAQQGEEVQEGAGGVAPPAPPWSGRGTGGGRSRKDAVFAQSLTIARLLPSAS